MCLRPAVGAGKWKAVVTEIKRMNKTGRPVLVGTTSVEKSEMLAARLKEAEIRCQAWSYFSPSAICIIVCKPDLGAWPYPWLLYPPTPLPPPSPPHASRPHCFFQVFSPSSATSSHSCLMSATVWPSYFLTTYVMPCIAYCMALQQGCGGL